MTLWPRSLLWRTVLLIALLLVAAQLASLQLLRWTEREPRARQIAQQVASVVNLTRSALVNSGPGKRFDLLRELSEREGIRIYRSGENDPPDLVAQRPGVRMLHAELRRLLGGETRSVFVPGKQAALWVSFDIDADRYWLVLPRTRLERPFPWRWLGWGALVLALSVLGAFAIVHRINRPLRQLTQAATLLGRGARPRPLPEAGAAEVRALTQAFNQMGSDLARVESERALLLAGISHDLRTPLSRLRLAVEMLTDSEALAGKAGMVQDIEDMDAIIGQFLAYGRDGGDESVQLTDLNELVRTTCQRYVRTTCHIRTNLAPLPLLPLRPMAMQRALVNLIDNAANYAASSPADAPQVAACEIEVQTTRADGKVLLSVLDRGPGIPQDQVASMLRPFTRLDSSRSNAGGAGLGLAIVERIARAHGGTLKLLAREGGGLHACLELPACE